MPSEPSKSKSHSVVVRLIVGTVISVLILALQISLPWASYRIGFDRLNQHTHFRGHSSLDWKLISKDRLRFDRFFSPFPIAATHTRCLSATICGDELIALLSKDPAFEEPNELEELRQLIRCHLKSGRISKTAAPKGIRYVLSDGKTVWWLPEHPVTLSPFIWHGKPTALASCSRNASLSQLIQFVDGSWKETGYFGLLPDSLDGDGRSLLKAESHHDRIFVRFDVGTQSIGTRMVYKLSLDVGSEEEARDYLQKHRTYINQMGIDDFQEMGWVVADRNQNRSDFGFWFEGDAICSVDYEVSDGTSMTTDGLVQIFQCECGQPGRDRTEEFISSPILLKSDQQFSPFSGGTFQIIRSADDRIYFLNMDRSDDRNLVLELKKRELHLVAQIGGWNAWLVLLDGILLFSLLVLIPTLVLGLVSMIIQRWRPTAAFSFEFQGAQLASVARRGMARVIDLSFVGGAAVLSVICHPEMTAWWHRVIHGDSQLRLNNLILNFDWDVVRSYFMKLHEFLLVCLTVPVDRWIFSFAVLLFVAQVVWQAKSGQTIGKWLLGIQVLRTTLRPCGFARSLLREILLVVDSTALVCWLPGVLAILNTNHSQRFGDLLADTIVVQRTRAIPLPLNNYD